MIYSSGSVPAQKLLFQYTNGDAEGGEKDLRGYVSGYFDTVNAGMKEESGSYVKIVEAMKVGEAGGERKGVDVGIEKWLFCSDRVEEVDAAREAGMQAVVVVREGNRALSESEKGGLICVESFDRIGGGKKT